MAALLSCEMDNTDKVVKHINECRERGIDIMPPDVNESFQDFTVEGNKIRFGLAAVKNVGKSAIESIITVRQKEGKFKSLVDLCKKIDLRKVNKKVMESLIKCGAFDSFKIKRSCQMAVFEEVVTMVQNILKNKIKNQKSMFEIIAETTGVDEPENVQYPDISEWEQKQMLSYEKECLGFYITGHPLDDFKLTLKACTNMTIANALAATTEKEVRLGGIVSSLKQITTKKGKQMGFVTFEDLTGNIELVVFPDLYLKNDSLLKDDHPLLVKGKISIDTDNDNNNNNNKILAEEIVPLDKAHEVVNPEVHLNCTYEKMTGVEINRIKEILVKYPGKSKVFFHLQKPEIETVISCGEDFRASASIVFIEQIESIIGKDSVNLY